MTICGTQLVHWKKNSKPKDEGTWNLDVMEPEI